MSENIQICGFELEKLLLDKGIILNLSQKIHLDDKISNWCKLKAYLDKLNIVISPESVALILQYDTREYDVISHQLSEVVNSNRTLPKPKMNKKLNFEQYAFVHQVKRILKNGTRFKLPALDSTQTLMTQDPNKVCKEVDQHFQFEQLEYTPPLTTLSLPPLDESKVIHPDSKHLLKDPVDKKEIQNLEELMKSDFKALLQQQLNEYMLPVKNEQDYLKIMEEKTNYEHLLSEKYVQSEQLKQYLIDKELDEGHQERLRLEKVSIEEKQVNIPSITSVQAIQRNVDHFYHFQIQESLKCMIYGLIDVAEYKSKSFNDIISTKEVENRTLNIISPIENLSLPYLTFFQSPCYKFLSIYKSTINLFNVMEHVQNSSKNACRCLIFTNADIPDSILFSDDITLSSVTILRTDELLNTHSLQNKVLEIFKFNLLCNLNLINDDNLNQFKVYVLLPESEDPDEMAKNSKIIINSIYPVIKRLDDIKLLPFEVKNSTSTLELPLIDEFHNSI